MSEDVDQAAPIASALVIGIGGSGVQTLARLRAAVRDRSRPGQTAIDNVEFLAIDAVEQNAQIPPLPSGTGLSKAEFYNIAREAVNAYDYVMTAWRHDQVLKQTWDVNYRAPNVPLTDGMKRSRPLGNLVFRIQSQQVESAIRSALNRVLAIDPEDWRAGTDGGRSKVPVFIVASCAGGTGSSGFLHVLHAVHRAARAAGVSAEVYPVVFLPDVFARARAKSIDPAAETRGHFANAYAFLSELDYVLTEPMAFDDLLCPPHEMATGVETIDVVKSVFLIDGRLTDGAQFDERDAFDIAATGVHALLVTQVRSLIGAEGVNNDFMYYDANNARLAYAGLGALRVVYPGSTYRRYLRARLRSYLLGSYLLDETANVATAGAPVRQALVNRLVGLADDVASKAREDDAARRLIARANSATEEVGDTDKADDIDEHLKGLLASGAKAAASLGDSLPALVAAARRSIDDLIDEELQNSGQGVATLQWAVNKAKEELTKRHETTTAKFADQRARLSALGEGGEGSLSQCMARVARAHDRVFFVRGGELKRAVAAYSEASERYAQSVVAAHVEEAQLDILRTSMERLTEVHHALGAATKVLRSEKDDADEVWRNDALEGKDAGGLHVTAVVPSDVQSSDTTIAEVEDSRIAMSSWARLESKLLEEDSTLAKSAVTGSTWLRHVYEEWWRLGRNHHVRGLVALGQGDVDARGQAEAQALLGTVLDQQVEELADVEHLLPTSLETAVGMADAAASGDVYDVRDLADFAGEETDQLNNLLRETIRKSAHVTIQVDPASVRLQNDAPLSPAVVSVGASGPMRTQIAEMATEARVYDSGDPEQVKTVAMQLHLPIAAVEGVALWHRSFQKVVANRQVWGQRSVDPPPHLDTRIAKRVLDHPLERRSYSDDVVAECVVQGLSLLLLKRESPELVQRFGDFEAMSVRREAELVMAYGHPLELVNDKVRAVGETVRLGETMPAIFDAVGRSPKLQTGTSAVFDYMVERARRDAAGQDTALRDAITAAITKYRESSRAEAAKLPEDHLTEEAVRERQVRVAIDVAAALLLDEIARERPIVPPII